MTKKSNKKDNLYSFGIHERIALSLVVPGIMNTYENAIKGQALMDKIKLSPGEVTEYEVRQIPGSSQVTWNQKGAVDRWEFELTPEDLEMLKEGYSEMNAKKMFHPDFIENYEKIVLGHILDNK